MADDILKGKYEERKKENSKTYVKIKVKINWEKNSNRINRVIKECGYLGAGGYCLPKANFIFLLIMRAK